MQQCSYSRARLQSHGSALQQSSALLCSLFSYLSSSLHSRELRRLILTCGLGIGATMRGMKLPRSAVTQWVLVSLVVAVVGLVLVVRVPGMDHHALGRIGGLGGKMDGSQCYMNVSYTVAGQKFRMKSSHDKRWCAYAGLHIRGNAYIPVYYEPSNPDRGTLEPRGPWPGRAVVAGALGMLACLVTARRRARQQLQQG